MKAIRWKYVLPRLAIVLVIGSVLRFGLDQVLKNAIVASGESSLGAKVEMSAVETSLWGGEIGVKDLALANPQSPMRNMLEATDASLQLDINALLHGRVVISDGMVSGLQFGTDRKTSGALAEMESTEEDGPSVFEPLLESASELGNEWLDQLGDRLDGDLAVQLRSPKLAKELEERWPQQYGQLEQQVKSICSRIKELGETIREVKENPLRGLDRLAKLQQELIALQQEMTAVQRQLSELPKQTEADRLAVLAARKEDEALLRKKLQIGTLDGEGLTQTLLGEPVTESLAAALQWISWARKQIPTSSDGPKELRGRGTTVRFTPPQPDYLIQRLQLEGSAQMNGEPLQLVGTLTGASNAPHLLDEPTRLQLRGSEALELDLEVVLDRRGEIATDRLQLSCPQLAMMQRTLGRAEKLAIEMGEGVASFEMKLTLTGEALEGEVIFVQNMLELTPRLASSPEGPLAETLSQALSGIDRLEANVTLAGTLEKPQVQISSDIGSQVAAGLNSSLKQLIQNRTDAVLAKSRAQVNDQFQQLTQLRELAQVELLGQLGEGQEMLGQLTALMGGRAKGLSRPAGIPQLGKSLRPDRLRKK